MNKATLLLVAALAGCAVFQPTQAAAVAVPAAEGARLGTYDSRVLALAYYRSEAFRARVAENRAAHERALAAGGAEAAHRIEQEMVSMQERAHLQGFGTEPVPEILALIEAEIPELARRDGVQAVASRWELAWREAGAVFPDLSFEMAAHFHPDAATLKMMKETAGKDPVPMEELEGSRD